MPLCQVELMACDQSIVVYPKEEEVQKDGGKVVKFAKPSLGAIESANERWNKRLEELKKAKAKKKNNTTPNQQ